MRRRSGFTLIEVMTAITITALVATVAAAALRAGIDVRERVGTHRVTIDAEARAFEWLGLMLRHSPAATAVNEPLLQIFPTSSGDSLVFLTRGQSPTAGTGAMWRVSLHADKLGLHVHSESVNEQSVAPMESVLPHILSLRVEALNASSGSTEWMRQWPVLRSIPSAVRLTFGMADGSTQSPLVFSMSPFPVSAQ